MNTTTAQQLASKAQLLQQLTRDRSLLEVANPLMLTTISFNFENSYVPISSANLGAIRILVLVELDAQIEQVQAEMKTLLNPS
jgi:hypothetical protein